MYGGYKHTNNTVQTYDLTPQTDFRYEQSVQN